MSRSLSPRPIRLSVAAVAAGALVLSACGGGDDNGGGGADAGGEGGGGGEIVVGAPQNFAQSLMPGNASASYVNYALFTSLTEFDPVSGEVVNAVAESLESEDNVTWTVTIADGWTFHNGEEVTAQSFADSWNATANPENAMTNSYLLAPLEGHAEVVDGAADEISGVEVTGELELTVTLTEPNALFPNVVSSIAYAPIPTSAAEDFNAYNTNPVGNGPFQLGGDGMTPGAQELTLERFEDYAGEGAKVDTVRLRLFQDASAVYTDFQAGGIDVGQVVGADMARAQSSTPDQVVDAPFPAVIWLGLPTYSDQFDDLDLRQAIGMSIDRETIVNSLVDGNGSPAVGIAPELLVGGGQDACGEICSYDADAAKALFDASEGFDGTLTIYSDADPTNQAIAQAVSNQLRNSLGIEAVPETMEVSALYDGFRAESIDGAFVLYSGTVTPNVYGLTQAVFGPGSNLNATNYDNPEVNELLSQARAATDPDDLTGYAQQAEEIALADARAIPIYHPVGGIVHAPNVSGVQPELLGGPDLSLLEVTD